MGLVKSRSVCQRSVSGFFSRVPITCSSLLSPVVSLKQLRKPEHATESAPIRSRGSCLLVRSRNQSRNSGKQRWRRRFSQRPTSGTGPWRRRIRTGTSMERLDAARLLAGGRSTPGPDSWPGSTPQVTG